MQKGFTLTEVIITVIILGILATLAIPRMTGSQDAAIAGEGIQALTALHGSQARWCLDHACGAGSYTTACDDYDVDIPALNNFGAPQCDSDGNITVTIDGGAYTLQVTADGVYSCSAGTCPGSVLRILP